MSFECGVNETETCHFGQTSKGINESRLDVAITYSSAVAGTKNCNQPPFPRDLCRYYALWLPS